MSARRWIRWAIVGVHGLYIGQWRTRQNAVNDHCYLLGKDWKYCRQKGDRAIKVEIRMTPPKPARRR